MEALGEFGHSERIVLAVWGVFLGLGMIVWLGSGTPIVGAVIVVAILLATASPSGALLATLAATPLIFHPIAIGSLQLSLLELGILVTALGTCFRMFFDLVSGNTMDLHGVLAPWFVWILPALVLLVGTLSLLWIPFDLHRAEALRSWRWVIVEPLIVFALARWTIARHARSWLVIALVVPGALVALAAIIQFLDATSGFAVDAVHRSTATYLHPNNLALYFERVFFLALAPGIVFKNRLRWPFLLVAAIIALGMITTFSRGVFLGIAVGSAVLLLAHPVRRGWSYLGFGLAGAGILFGLFATQRLIGADSSGFGTTRRYLWSDSIQMLRDFPVTGIGLDQFLWLHQQRYINPRIWSERYSSHPHNLVLDSWLSLGLVGLLLLGLFLGLGGWIIWSMRKQRRQVDAWQLGALASIGAGFGHGMVDNGYFLSDLSVLTWVCIALILADASKPGGETTAADD